jgi:hypothetical protein
MVQVVEGLPGTHEALGSIPSTAETKAMARDQPQWLTLLIPATVEAEFGRITVQDRPRQKVSKTPSLIAGHGDTYLSSQLSRRHK